MIPGGFLQGLSGTSLGTGLVGGAANVAAPTGMMGQGLWGLGGAGNLPPGPAFGEQAVASTGAMERIPNWPTQGEVPFTFEEAMRRGAPFLKGLGEGMNKSQKAQAPQQQANFPAPYQSQFFRGDVRQAPPLPRLGG